MSNAPWRVAKLGGSLLDRADLPARFRRWLADEPAMSTLVVCGGGAMVDVLRRWDRLRSLPSEDSHWLAIRLMSVSATVVAGWLPEADILDDVRSCSGKKAGAAEPQLAIFDPWPALVDDRWLSRPDVLPAGWDVTSDSIAARVAEHVGAEELVLLKSARIEASTDAADWRQRAAAGGYVDTYFPVASAEIENVRCVQLTDPRYDSARDVDAD
jgi:aspartokinase-like uncharacterized kinase